MYNLLKIALFLLSFSAVTTTAQAQTDKDAVLAVAKAGYDAFNSFDADRFAALFTEDADFIDPLGGMTHGREIIRQTHAQLFKMWGGNPAGRSYKWNNQLVEFYGNDLARITIHSTDSYAMGDKKMEDQSTITLIMVRQKGGWLVDFAQLTPVQAIPEKK